MIVMMTIKNDKVMINETMATVFDYQKKKKLISKMPSRLSHYIFSVVISFYFAYQSSSQKNKENVKDLFERTSASSHYVSKLSQLIYSALRVAFA